MARSSGRTRGSQSENVTSGDHHNAHNKSPLKSFRDSRVTSNVLCPSKALDLRFLLVTLCDFHIFHHGPGGPAVSWSHHVSPAPHVLPPPILPPRSRCPAPAPPWAPSSASARRRSAAGAAPPAAGRWATDGIQRYQGDQKVRPGNHGNTCGNTYGHRIRNSDKYWKELNELNGKTYCTEFVLKCGREEDV